jgi:hypothetical protein
MSYQDITICYYTANVIPEHFHKETIRNLKYSAPNIPIVSVSHKPMDLGTNIVVDWERHHINIYRQALLAAKVAKTKYIAMVEDDALYPPDHFTYRPPDDTFAYNFSQWGIYTWVHPAIFSHKGRRNLYSLVCNRELFIKAMEERFTKYPDMYKVNIKNWAEPGKYEEHLGVTEQKSMAFATGNPIVVFSHETALAYAGLGNRKRLGDLRAYRIPYWGEAEDILALYNGKHE